MLASLEIKNYLLIKRLKINFHKGFNTFTGETGAGKSIIIDGLKLALGGRNFKDLKIKENENIVLNVVFNINDEVLTELKKINIEIEDDYLIIKREISHEMKSKIYINNELTTQSQVKEISNIFIEIQDNYEQQELFNDSYFLEYIDKIAKLDKEQLVINYNNFKTSKNEFNKFHNKKEAIKKEIDYLYENLSKLKNLNPHKNEYSELINKKNLLKNKKQLINISNELMRLMESYDESSDILINIGKNLDKLLLINNDYKVINEKFNENLSLLSENLNEIKNNILIDEEETNTIEEIDNRIYAYNSLAKINNIEPEKINELFVNLSNTIEELKNYENTLSKFKKKYEEDKNDYIKEANLISKERKNVGLLISKEINLNLPMVNIEQGEIQFNFNQKNENNYSKDGIDDIDVGFKTIKNSDFSSIKKVASGGELSRLLLIMKTLISENDQNKTIIFDEVDSGLSGKVAGVVATKIVKISKHNQVLAITHSPQVAAKADKHWKIIKNIKDFNTMESSIIELNQEQRIDEIANIFSGSNLSEASRKVAKDLLLKSE
jgi:DNA repair protein RecN (Recombination protein N)